MSQVKKKARTSNDEEDQKADVSISPIIDTKESENQNQRGEKRKREQKENGEEQKKDDKLTQTDAKKQKLDDAAKDQPELHSTNGLADYLAEKEYNEDDLSNLVFNTVVPMYGLLYSLRHMFEETTGLEWDGVTSPEDVDKLISQVSSTPRKKKSKDGPTKPRSAYQFFCMDKRGSVNKDLGFGDQAKEMGKMWKQLSEKDREKYQEMADKDKERYFAEAGMDASQSPATPRRSRSGSTSSGRRASTSGLIAKDEGNIIIRSKRAGAESVKALKENDDVVLIDISPTSIDSRWGKFCLSYPHGQVAIPYHQDKWSMSVEGMFEGLKIFENAGVDRTVMAKVNMKALQRQERKNGKLLGWAKGLNGSKDDLLNAKQARKKLLLPAYKSVLKDRMSDQIKELKKILASGKKVVLLDSNTNIDLDDTDQQISAAYLLKLYLEGNYPV